MSAVLASRFKRLCDSPKFREFVRFALVGLIATGIHYGIYCLFNLFVNVNVAYTVGYVVSWFANLYLTAHFTFKSTLSFKKGVGFAVSHLVNYLLHMLFLNLFLYLGVSEAIAPLFVFAAIETNKQRKNNDASLAAIVDSGGIVALDQMLSSHRMAYAPVYYPNTFDELAKRLGLDTVCVYPHYCLDKYYDQEPPLENVCVVYDYYADDPDVPRDVIVLVIRIEEDRLQAEGSHVVFTIESDRHGEPLVFERNAPSYRVDGYGYYPFYYSRKDAEYLKSVRYEFAGGV